ncbi:hypothetical protein NP493_40g06014 [Ridgeia piscesae]|uniref:Uncharacterized protein n=1 Tax=Ridgeia piscesae TaxID=27915 RepID=A0AAD9PC24_RIDPI|nr:hypothetical protein NP493_40g06014 [Ridgeia piscesae]
MCLALSQANGRGMYMGKYGFHGGRRCAISCDNMPPGDHPSCQACNRTSSSLRVPEETSSEDVIAMNTRRVRDSDGADIDCHGALQLLS